MDINRIKEVILSQINGTSGLYSLKLQNHIYGCFLIMEDIAQQVISLDELSLVYADNKKTFHLEEQFSEIGLQYGFIMDNKLELESFNAEYKAIWLDCFKVADLTHNIELVDEIEDSIIDMLTTQIPTNDAFFLNALETGSLSDEWVSHVLDLLQEREPIPQVPIEEKVEETRLASAASQEKLIRSHKIRGAHKTRRHINAVDSNKKYSTTPKSKKKVILTRRNKNK